MQSWLANLTLEDEERKELGLPRVVCEYKDVFLEELLGLPPHGDVDSCIELHPNTLPISMTLHRMEPIELQELKGQLQSLLDRVLLDRALLLGALWYFFPKIRTRPFSYALTTDS